ncbi:MAG: hypothetical protein V4726_07325 [Verrucomicrobiota bacterium]
MNRFFRTSPAIYSAARAGLDAAFGHPKIVVIEDGTPVITLSCLPPVEAAVTGGDGKIIAVVRTADCEMPEVAPLIAALLASEAAEEVTDAEYFVALPTGEEEA